MNLEQLVAITTSDDFNRLALDQVVQSAPSGARWWQLHEQLVEHEAQLSVWTAGQYAKLLFQTYGAAVHEIKLDITTEADRGETFINHRLLINDVFCDVDYNEFEDEDPTFLDLLDERDDRAVFNAAVQSLNDTASSHTLSHLQLLIDAFKSSFKNTGDIDRMLAQHAPFVKAWSDLRQLNAVAEESRASDRPRSGSVSSRM